MCARVRERESAHIYVCVGFIDLGGGGCAGRRGGEIYLSEQRRIGDREERERRGMCTVEKERLKGERQMQKEIYR